MCLYANAKLRFPTFWCLSKPTYINIMHIYILHTVRIHKWHTLHMYRFTISIVLFPIFR